MNSLYKKILDRICENSLFFYNIYFPNSQWLGIRDACAWLIQENDKVYLCTQKYASLNCTFIHFNVIDSFLRNYNLRKILEVPEIEYRYRKEFKYHRVIYEIQEDNSN